ncbi:hypothetical protein GJU40_10700 [Bacillus lacus]|uniref:Type II secretion system protein GspF domain-containing protein n=1 Tax=Metabacillus lacus TaxID=1983721 RepID=A0A7X2IZF5_9BACI|nr:competence type IV pilus assembly protein ComGB [Metabacillus lacus]MRX72616.1 hypothetical protein [Metabacillus lacus]
MKNKNWKIAEQAHFLDKLSSLLQQGYSVSEALYFISIHLQPLHRKDVVHMISSLKQGSTLLQAFQELGFHRDVLSYLYFAEQHGDMEFALSESSSLLARRVQHKEKISRVLRYPILLLFVMGAILYVVELVVAPQFHEMYETMNITPSIFSTMLTVMFKVLKYSVFIIAAGALAGLVYYFLYLRKIKGTRRMDILLKVPFVKRTYNHLFTYYFSLQLSSLLKGGLSIYEALTVFKDQNLLPSYGDEAAYFIAGLSRGESFEMLLKGRKYYLAEIAEVVAHGQANGRLHRELYTYSQMLIDSFETKVVKLTSVIQPAAYIFIGATVLMVYLSMMMPMYQMMNHI